MTDLRHDPADDGLSELFGLAGGPTEEVTAPPSAPGAFPTRRELRARESASVAPRRSRSRAVGRDARTGRRRAVVVPREVAAYVPTRPTAGRSARKTGKGLIVILAVGGLFASAGLPAYALGVNGELNPEAAKSALESSSLAVAAESTIETDARGAFGATSPADLATQRSDAAKQANYELYLRSGARELGDDYPYFSELSNNQGGGLSPLNYFYRECVDFVAWRLNRDAGSTSAPYLLDWHYLTPYGGNASQWAYNWKAHGWATSTTPAVGWVAWFAGNHVGYVSAVNADGTVLIEEYNHQSDHAYGQRVIPATDVALYLSPPPVPPASDSE